MRRRDRILQAVMLALPIAFCATVLQTGDPARLNGVLHPVESRVGHVDDLTFEQSEALLDGLRARRAGEADPERRAVLSAQISDVLLQKNQPFLALAELDQALRLFPRRPELLARAALIYFAVGQRERAEAALRTARALAPDLKAVRMAGAIMGSRSGP